jgi:hypothetical protein
MTWGLFPGVPTALVSASTNPLILKPNSPVVRFTRAFPPVATHGAPAALTAPVPEPTAPAVPVRMFPTNASHLTSCSGTAITAIALDAGSNASAAALERIQVLVTVINPPHIPHGYRSTRAPADATVGARRPLPRLLALPSNAIHDPWRPRVDSSNVGPSPVSLARCGCGFDHVRQTGQNANRCSHLVTVDCANQRQNATKRSRCFGAA